MAPVFGYWKLRGLGQSIRLLLEYLGTEYEEKFYNFGPAPDFDRSEWLNEKFKLGLDLPNLPYYIDGDIKITQSHAILRHLGRQNNMCGKTEKDKIKVDMLEHQAMDIRMGYIRLIYITYPTEKDQYLKDFKTTMKALSDLLGSQPWFVGDQITFPDFLIYELLSVHLELDPTCLDKTNNLKEYVKRFEQLPKIKKYLESSRFIKAPLNGPMAHHGNI
nr:glutathione S-transferase Mu 4-like isoform X2 [Cherax quadricarinatus]